MREEMITPVIYPSPIGDLIRLAVMRTLAQRGEAPVEAVDAVAARVAECVKQRNGVVYDPSVWPRLFTREVEIADGVARLTKFGALVLRETEELVLHRLRRYGYDVCYSYNI